MAPGRFAWIAVLGAVLLASRVAGAVSLEPHPAVKGIEMASVDVRAHGGAWRSTSWDDLSTTRLDAGEYELKLQVDGGQRGVSVEIPHCAGRGRVELDGQSLVATPGPVVLGVDGGVHHLVVVVDVSKYERRIACGERPRVGSRTTSPERLGVMAFGSPYEARGGGKAVVYVPPGHDATKASAVLVGLHPWNGTMWTYAAYAELLRQARALDIVLLMPSGLGNALYTADAEDEAMRAIDALAEVLAIDPRAVSLWGASMGGAGATTVGFHHPDRFASVTSFFGDSKYDVSTYVRSLLPDEAAAHAVNALDVVDNAMHLPVWLIHGEADATSPIRQSEMLADAMRSRGLSVRFDRVPRMGHQGALVARFLEQVVSRAASLRVPAPVTTVAYRSVRPWDTGAYGVHLVRRSERGDAFVAAEARPDSVHITRAEGIRAIVVDPGALGTAVDAPPAIVVDAPGGVTARWAVRTR
jgi:pimeloyl-ACP methyl ester carboxylesterase